MFDAVKKFMEAAGQTTETLNLEQVELYSSLIDEELSEMAEAWYGLQEALEWGNKDVIGVCLEGLLKEINDVIWVLVGYGYSFGLPMKEGMEQIIETNLAKIIDGKVKRDPKTGKVLKPEGWRAPDYSKLIEEVLPKILESKGEA